MRGDDYLTRTIQQFAEVLAALVNRQADTGVTFNQLNKLSLDFIGLDLNVLGGLSTGQLLGLFTVAAEVNAEKVYMAATLLYHLSKSEADAGLKHSLEIRSYELLTRVRGEFGDFLNSEHEALVHSLAELLEDRSV